MSGVTAEVYQKDKFGNLQKVWAAVGRKLDIPPLRVLYASKHYELLRKCEKDKDCKMPEGVINPEPPAKRRKLDGKQQQKIQKRPACGSDCEIP